MSVLDNGLIGLLPRKDRVRLLGAGESVALTLAETICEPGTATRDVYFPVKGYISLVAKTEGSAGIEVGMVGREGMVGAQLTLGVTTTPLLAVVQGEGTAWRFGASAFRAELAHSEALRKVLSRYVYVLMAQLATSAACLRFHAIAPRLARWLLMSQDRAQSARFRVTHEFLAYMLGVRRVGITEAAGGLQRNGLIGYRRGDFEILDRSGLEAAACSCYSTDRHTYSAAMAE